jgi:cysteine desulfurase / selenocysteine lyase
MNWTLDQLLHDEELRLAEFPVAARGVFVAHAGVSPLPRCVADACIAYCRAAMVEDQEDALPGGLLGRTRVAAARLLQVDADEIALVGPTSLALSYVAGGLDFKRGDNVIVHFQDYPSNVYPWMALKERGVDVRYVKTSSLGRIFREDIESMVDDRTRLVALASCHYLSGWRPAIEEIGDWLRNRDILFCVDGIQTLGAFPLDARHVDFVAADAHKWLLGPAGAGILYVRREVQERLRPIVHGWNNVHCPEYLTQPELVWRSGGRRYEVGTHHLLALSGLYASINMLLDVGVDTIADRLRRLRRGLVRELLALDFDVIEANLPERHCGGIVSFRRGGTDMNDWAKILKDGGIRASLRTLPDGQKCLRLSPHFYNTGEEMERIIGVLRSGLK